MMDLQRMINDIEGLRKWSQGRFGGLGGTVEFLERLAKIDEQVRARFGSWENLMDKVDRHKAGK